MSQTATISAALTAEQLSNMNGEQIVKMGRELIAQLGTCPGGVNGNIWPGNIHFDEDGKAVLGESSDTPIRERTPEQIEYMAPEVFWENSISEASDLYSIALLMYVAYNGGCLPFTDSAHPSDLQRSQALRSRMKGQSVPILESAGEELSAIIAQALNFESNGRFSGSDEMMQRLSATDEALPSEAPDIDENNTDNTNTADSTEEASAADTVHTDAVEEVEAAPEEEKIPEINVAEMRPVEAEEGISASSIIIEQELQNIGREKKSDNRNKSTKSKQQRTKPAAAAKDTADKAVMASVSAAPESTEAAKETPNTQTPQKQASQKQAPKKEEKKAPKAQNDTTNKATKTAVKSKKKHVSGAIIAISAGVLVIAGMIGVAVYSLGYFTQSEPAEVVQATTIPTTEPSEAPEETEELVAVPSPAATINSTRFEAVPCDNDWADLENLIVIADESDMNKAIAAAEKAGLKNAWVGARYLSAGDAPNGEAGWYWMDGTALSEDNPYWGEGEPIQNEGGRLMLSYDSTSGEWHFRAVSAEEFAAGGTEMFPDMGYIAVSGAEATRPTPTPKPSPTPTLTPAPDYTEPVGNYSYSESIASTPVAYETYTEETTEPATPTPVPATPTPTPSKYEIKVTTDGRWYIQTLNEGTPGLVIVKDNTILAEIITLLNVYNNEHSDAKLSYIWLGAQYLTAENAPGGIEGWYWLDNSAMTLTAEEWIDNTTPDNTDGLKLMLKLNGDGAWKYAADSTPDTEILALYSPGA